MAAWDIADRLEEVKDELVKEFWRDLEQRLRDRTQQVGWETRCQSQSILAFPASGVNGRVLSIAVEDAASGVYYGILWPGGDKLRPGKPQIGALPFRLPGDDWKSSDWWVAYRYVSPAPLKDRRSMLSGSDNALPQLAKEIAEAVTELIELARDFIESEDRRCSASVGNGVRRRFVSGENEWRNNASTTVPKRRFRSYGDACLKAWRFPPYATS